MAGRMRDSWISRRQLMTRVRDLADQHKIPLRPQGPGPAFHVVRLKPGALEVPIKDYRDYVSRQDSARWAHLRHCLLDCGVRAIERSLWFVSLAQTRKDIREALVKSTPAFAQHAREWKPL